MNKAEKKITTTNNKKDKILNALSLKGRFAISTTAGLNWLYIAAEKKKKKKNMKKKKKKKKKKKEKIQTKTEQKLINTEYFLSIHFYANKQKVNSAEFFFYVFKFGGEVEFEFIFLWFITIMMMMMMMMMMIIIIWIAEVEPLHKLQMDQCGNIWHLLFAMLWWFVVVYWIIFFLFLFVLSSSRVLGIAS